MWTDEMIAQLNDILEETAAQEKIAAALLCLLQETAKLEARTRELKEENQKLRSAQETPELQ